MILKVTPELLNMISVSCPVCGANQHSRIAIGKDFEYNTSNEEFYYNLCLNCGVYYLNPRPVISELPNIYPTEYEPYHFNKKTFTLQLRRWLVSRSVKNILSLIPEESELMDVGCGSPSFLEILRQCNRPKWHLWGCDISPKTIQQIRLKGFEAICSRFEELEMPDAFFNAIFMRQVLEHLEKPLAVMQNAARLLKPSGILLIETPNMDAWDAYLFRNRYWGGYHFPRHWTLFSADNLIKTGEQVGLKPLSTTFMLSPVFWTQSWHHYLMDKMWPDVVFKRFNFKNPFCMVFATLLDCLQKLISGKTSNMRIVFTKSK